MTRQREFDRSTTVTQMRQRTKRDPDLKKILEVALKHPDLRWARFTTSGMILAGPNGTAGTHFSGSDIRAHRNFISDLRTIGLYPTNRKA